ncbi:MAG: hypothetical protein QNL03_01605 [Gammaproteobacteria bacterium]|nr:hypothetical protein [Gammaproteobacteria bacterium]
MATWPGVSVLFDVVDGLQIPGLCDIVMSRSAYVPADKYFHPKVAWATGCKSANFGN